MKIGIETLTMATVVVPEGRLDFGAAPDFQRQIEAALSGTSGPPKAVIIDCAGLDYVSSAGLRAFLVTARAAQRAGVSFALCTLKPAVREVFDLSGFSRVLAVLADRAAALAQVSQSAS
jgi:anti-sigma B factor antagonist